jgi:hypothetical protein
MPSTRSRRDRVGLGVRPFGCHGDNVPVLSLAPAAFRGANTSALTRFPKRILTPHSLNERLRLTGHWSEVRRRFSMPGCCFKGRGDSE